MEGQVTGVASGEYKPPDNAERLFLAQLASDHKKLELATRLSAEALDGDPKLGDDYQAQHRYTAACAAVLLTTRDASAVESLGEDYPFYCGPTEAEVAAAIRAAEDQVGGTRWQQALGVLAEIKRETSLDHITGRYVEYLSRFGELRCLPADSPAPAEVSL